MIQECGEDARPIEEKIDELASLPETRLTAAEIEEINRIGDNTGCMELKGANPGHVGDPLPDRWTLSNDHGLVADRWEIDPARDLACTHGAKA